MIHLATGAKVIAAYIVPAAHGMKANGLVLAERPDGFVTWKIYSDDETIIVESHVHELWQCETGNYFDARRDNLEDWGNARVGAERDFGRRLLTLMSLATWRGMDAGTNA